MLDLFFWWQKFITPIPLTDRLRLSFDKSLSAFNAFQGLCRTQFWLQLGLTDQLIRFVKKKKQLKDFFQINIERIGSLKFKFSACMLVNHSPND